mgnify:CR=1 FL=1
MIEEKLKEKIKKVKNDNNRTISLYSDVIFKAVFKKCERILITMIKDIFELEEDVDNPITIVGYESLPINKNGKTYKADLVVKLSDKSRILVEMNYSNDEEVIDRNLVQLVRIHSDILPKGLEDSKLKEYRLKGINFNNFPNTSGDPIEMFAFCNIKTGNIISMMYSFCNVDLEKCRNLVYDIGVSKLPKAVRWGAILKETNINKISDILGKDMLSMEEKKEFIENIKDVNSDDILLNDWLLIELQKHKERCQREYAMKQGREEGLKQGIKKGREEGLKQGIKEGREEVIINMLNIGMDYNIISEVTGKTTEEIKEIHSNI